MLLCMGKEKMRLERNLVEADSSGSWGFGFCSKCNGKAENHPGMDYVLCFKNDVHAFVRRHTHTF